MRSFLQKFLMSLPGLMLGLFVAQTAHAKIYDVNVFDDPTPVNMGGFPDNGCDTGGRCSLREAVLAAQVNGDTTSIINLAAGTYTLTLTGSGEDNGLTGDLDVAVHSLTIGGAGANQTTIDASALGDRAFDLHYSGGNEFTLNSLSVQGGTAPATDGFGGGAILFAGFVPTSDIITINDSDLSGNSAGGTLSGGAILAVCSVAINNSTISNNSTSASGVGGGLIVSTGIGLDQFLKINNSTISGNTSGTGGGIYTGASRVLIRSSTISNNTANSNNAGGIFLGDNGGFNSNADIENTILSGNTSASGSADCDKTALSTATTQGYNIFGSVAGCTFVPTTGDQLNVTDPKLEPLAIYGGETATQLLQDDSTAIDGGSPGSCLDADGNVLSTDQRGQTRPIGANCDIGSVELGTADITLDKTVEDSTVGVGDDITYVLTVTNQGPDDAMQIVVSDTLPGGGAVSFVSGMTSTGGTCTEAAGVVTCVFGRVNNGDTVTASINVVAEQEGTFTNTATAVGSERDASEATDSVNVRVNGGGGGGGCSFAPSSASTAYAALTLLGAAVGGMLLLRKRSQ